MRSLLLRVALSGGLLLAAGVPGGAQASAQEQAKSETAEQQNLTTWKLVNTALFAVLLAWGIAKTAPRFFNARSADIQKAIQDATGLKIQADFRYSEIDRKMATLSEEVKRLREQAAAEMEHEHERVRQETQHERERIAQNVRAEIEGIRFEGMAQVRRRTAQAALALAEQQLHDRAASSESGFLGDFVRLVEKGSK